MKQIIEGRIWYGYKGELLNPAYIIQNNEEQYIDELLKPYSNKKIRITIEIINDFN